MIQRGDRETRILENGIEKINEIESWYNRVKERERERERETERLKARDIEGGKIDIMPVYFAWEKKCSVIERQELAGWDRGRGEGIKYICVCEKLMTEGKAR